MTNNSVSETKELVMGWYTRHSEIFDQEDNKALFKFFITKFLGLPLNPVAEMRMDKYSWSTIERVARKLVEEQKIELSEESKEARHIEEQKTKKSMKEAKPVINYEERYVFMPGGRAVLRQ